MPGVRRILGAFFVAVLLAAQQAALEHPLWHVSAAGGEKTPLCAQHDALGAVAGAIDCAVPVLSEESPATAAIAAVLPSTRAGAPLQPSSRGPPTLL